MQVTPAIRTLILALTAALGGTAAAAAPSVLESSGHHAAPATSQGQSATGSTTASEAPAASAETSANPTTTSGKPKSFWLHLNSTPTSKETLTTEAKRRSYVVLNAWEADLIPTMKAANPALQVYVYKDLTSTRSYACRNGTDDAHLPAGIGYCEAEKNHPEWFLTGPDGKRFEYSGYSGHWQMDVGNQAYQTAWADKAIADSKGFDGLYLDNALMTCDAYHEGVCPTKYNSDTSMRNAYLSMLRDTRAKFTTAGLKTIANLSNARLHAGAWDAYMEHLDGGLDEWWVTFSDDNRLAEYPEGWSRQVAQIASNEAKGKITLVQPHFTPNAEVPFRYALASYLLAAGSKAAIAEISQTDGYGDPSPWRPEYDLDLGAPTGPYKAMGDNVFRRDFACGVVVVNASRAGTTARSIPLGESYTDANRATVATVSLAGTSGAVLQKTC